MKLYTRTGDGGMTTVAGGARVPKTDARIAACGDIDELNAHTGLLAAMAGAPLAAQLEGVQKTLFDIGTTLSAGRPGSLSAADIGALETLTDSLQQGAPPVDTFVLPGGCTAAAQAHVCRTVCRRAERSAVALARGRSEYALALQYLNRLGDYFFAAALNLNFIAGVAEKKLYIPCK